MNKGKANLSEKCSCYSRELNKYSDKELYYHSTLAYQRYQERIKAQKAGDKKKFERLKQEHAKIQTYDKAIEVKCESKSHALTQKLDLSKLKAKDILKNAKPIKSKGGFSFNSCGDQYKKVEVVIDDTFYEGNKICTEKVVALCKSKGSWVTAKEYIEKRYPSSRVVSHSQSISIASKGDKTIKTKKITACLDKS